jgi:hypothetical protein
MEVSPMPTVEPQKRKIETRPTCNEDRCWSNTLRYPNYVLRSKYAASVVGRGGPHVTYSIMAPPPEMGRYSIGFWGERNFPIILLNKK